MFHNRSFGSYLTHCPMVSTCLLEVWMKMSIWCTNKLLEKKYCLIVFLNNGEKMFCFTNLPVPPKEESTKDLYNL